eukprot:scaffold32567_cov123-Isochrysis_galbana.AAC.4
MGAKPLPRPPSSWLVRGAVPDSADAKPAAAASTFATGFARARRFFPPESAPGSAPALAAPLVSPSPATDEIAADAPLHATGRFLPRAALAGCAGVALPASRSPLSCKVGKKAVVRPATVSKWMRPIGEAIEPEVSFCQRWWNSQCVGKREESAWHAHASEQTRSTAACTASSCLSERELQGALGSTRAWKSTSSATQLPTPHTTRLWSSNAALMGLFNRRMMSRNSLWSGGPMIGSLANAERGGLTVASGPRSRMRPNRRGSAYAIVAPLLSIISSLVKRGGHRPASMLKLWYRGASTPRTSSEPVMPRCTSRLALGGPAKVGPSSSHNCLPRRRAERMKAPSTVDEKSLGDTPSANTLSSKLPSRGPPPCSVKSTATTRCPTACASSMSLCASTSGSSGIVYSQRAGYRGQPRPHRGRARERRLTAQWAGTCREMAGRVVSVCEMRST